jgi:hypothetical protein
MNLTPEQQQELAPFPAALTALVETELAAGNTIVEIGGGHPAPPVGACVKLANQVSTRPRASGDGLDFYERNSSSYSGEFTDGKRFFFVLEAPNPPPPEPDMDAIRRAHQPKPGPLVQLAQREAGWGVELADDESSSSPSSPADTDETVPPARALTVAETAMGAKRLLHFRDRRPPHEVQFALERELMVLFAGAMDEGQLRLLARGYVNGARYFFELRFEAALLLTNCYSLRVEGSWGEHLAANHDYFRKTSESWFTLWTRELRPANPPKAGAGSPERYRKLAEAALETEGQLDSVAAIQQAIVAGLRHGGTFTTSHKEGGTNIGWRGGKFIRSDFGDYPDHKEFTDEAEFLRMLRQFCRFDVTRHAGTNALPEVDEWKLILRRLRSE